MSHKPVLLPGPDHPITVERRGERVTATAGGRVIADSTATLTLQEAGYPAVEYFPRADVDMTAFERSEHTTYCPYKGEASYYDVVTDGSTLDHAVWTYETPHPALAEIKEYVAFYPDRVDVRVGSAG